jgi:hypothetical protein
VHGGDRPAVQGLAKETWDRPAVTQRAIAWFTELTSRTDIKLNKRV